jgi:hypothetical protein
MPSVDLRGVGRTIYAINTAYPTIKPDVWIGLDGVKCFDERVWDESFMKVCRKLRDTEAMRLKPNTFFASMEEKDAAQMLIARDNESTFVWSRSTFLFALHFILWRGHRKIHLIGCDMGGPRDYHDDRVLTEDQRKRNRQLYAEQVRTLRRIHPMLEDVGIELTSCTPESPVNEFLERRSIEKALSDCLPPKIENEAVYHVTDTIEKNVVLVWKSGGDFKRDHVERLIRQLPQDCKVTILTDDYGLLQEETALPLRYNFPGWWSKMEMFRPDLMPDKPFLYIDLDTSVLALPNEFFRSGRSIFPGSFTNPSDSGIQSSLMWLHPETRARIWDTWAEKPREWMERYGVAGRTGGDWGDQGFIRHEVDLGPIFLWHDYLPGAVMSYKFNILTNKDVYGNPVDRSKVMVICFHGKPRPWEVEKLLTNHGDWF